MADALSFFRAFLRAPTRIGAVAPSSPALASMMVESADLRVGHKVVELGAGTGPMTRALLHAYPALDLLVLEPDPALAARCRDNVPAADVVEAVAQDLPDLIARRGWERVDRVVSSLPFASFSTELQTAILDSVEAVLAPGGRMVTFTYVQSPYTPSGRHAKAALAARFAAVRTSPVVWGNVPPAFVYICDHA